LGFGIWLESPKNKTCREWLGVVLVLGGCVFSVIATVGLLVFDEGISRGQQSKIISLESYLLPRVITEEQGAFLVKQLASPFKIEYAFSVGNDEEAALASELSISLDRVGWQWVNWPAVPGQMTVWFPYAKKIVGTVMLSGIQVGVCNPKLSGIAETLVSSMKTIGLESVRLDAADCRGSPNAMLIEIMIGQKPRYIPPPSL
jgi:hypothetical protein